MLFIIPRKIIQFPILFAFLHSPHEAICGQVCADITQISSSKNTQQTIQPSVYISSEAISLHGVRKLNISWAKLLQPELLYMCVLLCPPKACVVEAGAPAWLP
jgi:hypothetical protein